MILYGVAAAVTGVLGVLLTVAEVRGAPRHRGEEDRIARGRAYALLLSLPVALIWLGLLASATYWWQLPFEEAADPTHYNGMSFDLDFRAELTAAGIVAGLIVFGPALVAWRIGRRGHEPQITRGVPDGHAVWPACVGLTLIVAAALGARTFDGEVPSAYAVRGQLSPGTVEGRTMHKLLDRLVGDSDAFVRLSDGEPIDNEIEHHTRNHMGFGFGGSGTTLKGLPIWIGGEPFAVIVEGDEATLHPAAQRSFPAQGWPQFEHRPSIAPLSGKVYWLLLEHRSDKGMGGYVFFGSTPSALVRGQVGLALRAPWWPPALLLALLLLAWWRGRVSEDLSGVPSIYVSVPLLHLTWLAGFAYLYLF